jgi:hypothetical protein
MKTKANKFKVINNGKLCNNVFLYFKKGATGTDGTEVIQNLKKNIMDIMIV